MINAIIVDDEWYTLEEVKSMAEATGYFNVCGVFENPLKALENFEKLMPQVAFLDVEMPEMDGLTLAEKLLEKNPSLHIVFITAYNQYAVQAFDLNALDYIMKPINAERFDKMVKKLKKFISITNTVSKSLKIQCFGEFTVKINDMNVKWERAKTEELCAYLLANHNKKVHKESIIEDLWGSYGFEKALPILQTSACKLRNIFKSVDNRFILKYEGGGYYLSITDHECDLFLLEDYINNFNLENENVINNIEKAFEMIQSGFLPQNGYLWAYPIEARLRTKLTLIIENMVQYYRKKDDKKLVCKYEKMLDTLNNE